MSFLINDNNFSLDTYGLRGLRLDYLSGSISRYAAEISLSGDLLDWALNSKVRFESARTKSVLDNGEVNVAYQIFHKSMERLQNRYQIFKNILKSNYYEDTDKFEIFGIDTNSPDSKPGIYNACEKLISGNQKLKELGDSKVLPDAKIEEFQNLLAETKTNELNATMSNEHSKQTTRDLHRIYKEDTIKLRAVYNLAVAAWGKYDPRFIPLGMVEAKERHGGKRGDVPENISFNETNNMLTWNASEDVTSYQIAFTDSEKKKPDWNIVNSGKSNQFTFEDLKGNIKIKLRSRNKNGYGAWSDEIFINI